MQWLRKSVYVLQGMYGWNCGQRLPNGYQEYSMTHRELPAKTSAQSVVGHQHHHHRGVPRRKWLRITQKTKDVYEDISFNQTQNPRKYKTGTASKCKKQEHASHTPHRAIVRCWRKYTYTQMQINKKHKHETHCKQTSLGSSFLWLNTQFMCKILIVGPIAFQFTRAACPNAMEYTRKFVHGMHDVMGQHDILPHEFRLPKGDEIFIYLRLGWRIGLHLRNREQNGITFG